MKQRDLELAKGWVQIVNTLEIHTEGGWQKMNCANTEGIFRIIQSIPSPKAGGDIAGNARKQLEKRIKRPIVSRDNFLGQSKKAKKLPYK